MASAPHTAARAMAAPTERSMRFIPGGRRSPMANSREAWDVADWRKAFIKHAVEAARLFGLAAAGGLANQQF